MWDTRMAKIRDAMYIMVLFNSHVGSDGSGGSIFWTFTVDDDRLSVSLIDGMTISRTSAILASIICCVYK